MNNDRDGDMADSTPRFRLLTFDRLPFLIDDELDDAWHWLCVQSVFFEQHHLQKPGIAGILQGLLVNRETPESLRGAHVALFRCDDTPATVDVQEFPAEWNVCVHHIPEEGATAESLAALAGQPAADFVWWHVETDDSGPTDEMFFAYCAAMEASMTGATDNAVVFVTALYAECGPETEYSIFESLLPEPQIRVPLWLLAPTFEARRIPVVTGSNDIGWTVSRETSDQAMGTELASATPCDLVQLARHPGGSHSRDVIIETEQAKALRTKDFLFVRQTASSRIEAPSFALYVKPTDVWNVHNVSGEFLDTSDELQTRLI